MKGESAGESREMVRKLHEFSCGHRTGNACVPGPQSKVVPSSIVYEVCLAPVGISRRCVKDLIEDKRSNAEEREPQ